MSNRYSNYPSTLDELKQLPEYIDQSVEYKQKAVRYEELLKKSTLTPQERAELNDLVKYLQDGMITSQDWNKVIGAIENTEDYFKNTILTDIGNIVDIGENNIENAVNNSQDFIYSLGQQIINDMRDIVQKIVDAGELGVDYFTNRVVVPELTRKVSIGIPEYDSNMDFLMVYMNGVYCIKGVHYLIGVDKFSIVPIGDSWETGVEFDFIVCKKTVVLLEKYDVGLFNDESIRREKLTLDIQNDLDKVSRNAENIDYLVADVNDLNFELKVNGVLSNKDLKTMFVDKIESENSVELIEGRYSDGKLLV